jgi:hypothetical protein
MEYISSNRNRREKKELRCHQFRLLITVYLSIPALVPRRPLGRVPLEVMSEPTHLQFPWARVSSKDLALISFTLVVYDHAITFAEEVSIIAFIVLNDLPIHLYHSR